MDANALHRDITAFFNAFVAAFTSFDGGHIAERYAAPYQALDAQGNARCHMSQADIGSYFQGIVDQYRAQGCKRCSYSAPEFLPLGQRSALATVTWHLHGDQGHIISTWRESYTLTRRADERLYICASVDH